MKVGIAGWSYPDWNGIVYPADRSLKKLRFMANFFRSIEINSTFYRIPASRLVEQWRDGVSDVEDFTFTVKLLQDFTHSKEATLKVGSDFAGKAAAFKQVLQPLLTANRLGGLLVQFPYSFHFSSATMEYLKALIAEFQGFPLAVEVRHRSFQNGEFFSFLREQGVGFVNIDQPNVSYSLPITTETTSPLAYVRFHGRNRQSWFDPSATRDQRYDYDYSRQELNGWVERVETLSRKSTTVFAIFNNHFRGQEVANALEFMYLWTESPVVTPPLLKKAYPRLNTIASEDKFVSAGPPETLSLFPEE